jgi:hypothetical protein
MTTDADAGKRGTHRTTECDGMCIARATCVAVYGGGVGGLCRGNGPRLRETNFSDFDRWRSSLNGHSTKLRTHCNGRLAK